MYCLKCGSPVRFKEQIDRLGNKVNTISCWNGHYEQISFKDIKEDKPPIQKEISKAFPFVDFNNSD